MDAKLLAKSLSFVSLFLAIYAQSAEAFQLEAAIYYGDSSVEIGKPFKITCIIPTTDPIYWLKDGEPIMHHNLRHGRDEHSYVLSESAIEGENHKIEAHLSVRHALKIHEGRYQCNKLHSSYHTLHVRNVKREQESNKQSNRTATFYGSHMSWPGTSSGSGSGSNNNAGVHRNGVHRNLPTETTNRIVPDIVITSSKSNDNEESDEIFTRTWEPAIVTLATPQIHALPTQKTTINDIWTQQSPPQQQQQHHHHSHPHPHPHHRHHQLKQYPSHLPKLDNESEHKLVYTNATKYDDDIASSVVSERPYDRLSPSLLNIHYNRYSTKTPWHNSTIYFAIPSTFIPPPRKIATSSVEVNNKDIDISQRRYFGISGGSGEGGQPQETYYVTTGGGFKSNADDNSQYPGQFEFSPSPQSVPSHTQYKSPKQKQQIFNTMVTFPAKTSFSSSSSVSSSSEVTVTSIYQNPFLQYKHQYPKFQGVDKHPQQSQRHHQYPLTMTSGGVTSVVATSPPLFAPSSSTFGLLSPSVVHRHGPTFTSNPYLITPNNNSNNSIITNINNTNINVLLTQLKQKNETDFLVPNYDNAEHELKVFEIRGPLMLSCNVTKEGSYELKWEKNGTQVSKVKELAGRYRILDAERKFIIDKTNIYDDGLYSCVADNKKRDFNVVSLVVVRVPSNLNVVEGEKLSIDCAVVGTDPQLSWSFGNMTITNTTGRYVLKPNDKNVQNAILTIDNISLTDRGEFKCIGQNAANFYANYKEASDVSLVRVKGKFAALWPFLGICAEVLILCAIILIYEKRRNRDELEDSDTEQEQRKKRRNYD